MFKWLHSDESFDANPNASIILPRLDKSMRIMEIRHLLQENHKVHIMLRRYKGIENKFIYPSLPINSG